MSEVECQLRILEALEYDPDAIQGRLASQYLDASLRVYRELRQAARETLAQVRGRGYVAVKADGKGETMGIFLPFVPGRRCER